MNKHILKNLLILPFALALMASCSGKKAASPTSFKLSGLSAITADSATVPGGVVLMGSNGTDKFTAGIRPSDLASFSLDLPSGNWNFSAIAWQGAAPMTGATQCGLSTTTIEGASMVVSLTLSAANCQLAAFASAGAFSLGSPNFFKTLTINSCLNPVGKTVGDICDGSDVADKSDIPGESLSFRVQVSSGSTFGAALPPLSSACYNISGLPTLDLISGVVDTPLTLPFGGSINMPLRLIGYEKPDCPIDDVSAIYPVVGGFQGAEGVYRTVDSTLAEKLFVSIADNLVGFLGSPFLQGYLSSEINLPLPSCGKECFNTLDNSRNIQNLWSQTRDAAWDLYGSPNGTNAYDFEPDTFSPGTETITSDLGGAFTLTTLPGRQEDIELMFFNNGTPGVAPAVSCSPGAFPSQGTINVTFDPGRQNIQDIVNVLSTEHSCQNTVIATFGAEGGGEIFAPSMLMPMVTNGAYIAKRREHGRLHSTSYTLIGPLGAILAKNGVPTFSQLCAAPAFYFTHTLATGEAIGIEYSTPSASAALPIFPGSTAGQFEKKIMIYFDGVAEEAFYFNCSANLGMGAVVDKENENGKSYIEQTFWNATMTELWSESVSYSEDVNNFESWRRYTLSHLSGGTLKLWSLSGDSSFQNKFVSTIDIPTSNLYAQDSFMSGGGASIDFSLDANDVQYTIGNGGYVGPSGIFTAEPPMPNLILDTTVDGFLAEDPYAPSLVWDLSF